jgi:hypothetical protein
VNDDTAHDELVKTLDSIQSGVGTLSETLGGVNKWKFQVDVGLAYLKEREDTATGIDLIINPASGNRLYRARAGAHAGRRPRSEDAVLHGHRSLGRLHHHHPAHLRAERQLPAHRHVRIPDQARRPPVGGPHRGPWGRGGGDPALQRALWIRGSAWDFGREGPLGEDLSPHLRFSGRWFFHPNFYVLGGVDDPLEQDSLFLGAGARWTDENLKWLLRAMPGGVASLSRFPCPGCA